MINFDDYNKYNKYKYNRAQFKVDLHSRSSIKNTYYRWFWIRKNERIIKFNK